MFFFEGFEQFAFDGDSPAFMRRAGYTVSGSFGFGAGRKNGASVLLGRGRISRDFPSDTGNFTVGFAFNMTTRGNLVGISGGDSTLKVGVDQATGLLQSEGESGYVIPLRNNWYYLEVEVNKDAKTADVYINGKKDITVSIPDGVAMADTLTITLRDFDESDFADIRFDDLYYADTTRVGPITVTTRVPTKDVSKDWGVSGGESHHEVVAPALPNLVDRFIYTGTNGATDSFTSETVLSEETEVKGVSVITLLRKATVDPVSVDVFTNELVKNEATLPRDWEYRYSELGVLPEHVIPDSTFGITLKA
ncbi:hypothetical protein [Proteus mirabilis]|uniref:hypothetical protein n=1 Tax=Proteus mirabilis TaxID=584 RepID=UPI0038A0A8EA